MTNKFLTRVGDGRGFVVEDKRGQPFVITAAHCLPTIRWRGFQDE
jgi:hypothetical protein